MLKRYNRFYLVVIADYNDDDAHGIVHDNLYYWFDEHDLEILEYDRVDVAAFNTTETGYVLSRRALNPLSPSRRQVFFVNTAPRMDELTERPTNQGEGFVWAELRNGKHVFAVNSGHTLSLIKPEIEALRKFNVPENPEQMPMLMSALRSERREGFGGDIGVGQFRSGYVYPIVVARSLVGSDEPISPNFQSLVGTQLSVRDIPDIPADTVAYRDGYGNLKTTIATTRLAKTEAKFAVVACNGSEVIAHIRSAIFDVPLHHFSLAPGSTVLAYSDGTRRQFVELVLRGGHAAKAFAQKAGAILPSLPIPGDRITWRAAENNDFQRLGFARDGSPPTALLKGAVRP